MLPAGQSLPCLGERVTGGLPDARDDATVRFPGVVVALARVSRRGGLARQGVWGTSATGGGCSQADFAGAASSAG